MTSAERNVLAALRLPSPIPHEAPSRESTDRKRHAASMRSWSELGKKGLERRVILSKAHIQHDASMIMKLELLMQTVNLTP
jgi:hypothetical protein